MTRPWEMFHVKRRGASLPPLACVSRETLAPQAIRAFPNTVWDT